MFGRIQLNGDAAEAKVEDTGVPGAVVTENSIGVSAGHGDAFGFALNSEDRWSRRKQIAGNGRGTWRRSRSDGRLGFFRCAPGFNRNWLRRGGGLFRSGSCGGFRSSRGWAPLGRVG